MSDWGKKIDGLADGMIRATGSKGSGPGWYPIPGRPGLQGYWDGQAWDQRVPPRPEPEPMWKRAWPVFAGVAAALVLLAILF